MVGFPSCVERPSAVTEMNPDAQREAKMKVELSKFMASVGSEAGLHL